MAGNGAAGHQNVGKTAPWTPQGTEKSTEREMAPGREHIEVR
jgi:hypothetical protein